jgi:hypothetical protein
MNFLSQTIYSLKNRYGAAATYRSFVSTSLNLDTGAIAQVAIEVSIAKLLVFPEKMARKFIYDLAYVAANKNFTYGGQFDEQQTLIAIDSRDLGVITPKVDDHLIIHSTRFEVKKVIDYPEDRVFLLGLTRLENQIGSDSGVVISPDLSPDIAWGVSAGDSIAVNDLVFVNAEDIYLASEDDITRPAMGIVTHIEDGKIYHTRNGIIRSVTIAGTPSANFKDIYLGTDGGMTFEQPTTAILQRVAFAVRSNLDGSYDIAMSISASISLV